MWVTGPYTASFLTSIQALDVIRTKDSVYDTYYCVGGGNWCLPSKEMRYISLFHPLTKTSLVFDVLSLFDLLY